MEKKSHKKLLIAIISLIFLGLAGFAAYWFLLRTPAAPLITLENGKMYPAFSANTTSYTIYTKESSLSFSCSGEGTITGCDAPVALVVGSATHQITIGEHVYSFAITRLDSSDTTLKIKSVRGVPTTWVSSADLTVSVENSGSVKEIEYSFDGGRTWRSSNVLTFTENGTYKIVARDYFGLLSNTKTVKLDKLDSAAPIVSISKEQTKDQAILTAVATDELSGIKSYKWNTGATTESIIVKTNGTYYVTVTDKVGNAAKKSVTISFEEPEKSTSSLPDSSSDKSNNSGASQTPASSPAQNSTPAPSPTPSPTPAPTTYTFVAQFLGNGATASSFSTSCTTTGSSCTVRAAGISRSGYEILGWSTNPNATTSDYAVGADIIIHGNTRLYAITKKVATLTFEIRDSSAATASATSASCVIYNTAQSCNVATPTLTAKTGYTALGWSAAATSTATNYAPNATATISNNGKLYSNTHQTAPLTATFSISDSAAATQSGGVTSCLLYNGATSCALKAPTLTAKPNYAADGWHDPVNDSSLASGAAFLVTSATSGRTYYAATRSTLVLSATFNLQDSAHLAKTSVSTSCTPVNGSCSIDVPSLTATDDVYEAFGWSKNASATSAESLGSTLTLTSANNGTVYYSVSRRKAPVSASFTIKDSAALSAAGSLTPSCYLYNGATSCNITAPSLSATSGYTFDGWSRTDGATSSNVAANSSVSLSSDTSFYSVSHNNTPRSATFNIVNTSISRFSDHTTAAKTSSCYLYNGATSCNITSPGIDTDASYTALGWATSNTATSAEFAAGSSVTLTGTNQNYYSVVSNAFTITFESSDPSHLTFANNATTTTQVCNLSNASSCTVNFPSVATSDGREFLGWARSEGATTAEYAATDHPTVSSAITYRTVSKKTITLSFTLVDSAHFSLASSSASCSFYNSASSCPLAAPSVTAATNYALLGWSTTSGATTYSWNGSAQNFSTSANYYSVSRYSRPAIVNFNVPSAHTGKITVSKTSDYCYVMNGGDACFITMPSATTTSSSYTFSGWGVQPNVYDNYFPPNLNLGFTVSNIDTYSSGIVLYAVVGTLKGITFVNDESQTGSNPNVLSGNNIAATAISFTSGNCVNYSGTNCYIKKMPYLYSPGNDIFGFSATKLSGSVITNTGGQSVADGSTFYSRIWNTLTAKNYPLAKTYIISFTSGSGDASGWTDMSSPPAANAEYYAMEFENDIDSDVRTAYADFVLEIASHLPSVRDFHGKLRFMTSTTFDPLFNPDPSATSYTAGVTHTYGQFSPVAIRLATNAEGKVTSVSDWSKYTIIHEFGHATEELFLDRTGQQWFTELDNLRLECYNLRKSGTPCLSDYAFYNVTYDDATGKFVPTAGHDETDSDAYGKEFFAELFAAWYSEHYTSIDISTAASNSGTKHNAEFEASVNGLMDKLVKIIANDYNMAAANME